MRHARFAALIVATAVGTLMASTAGSGAAGRDFDNPTSHDTGQQFATGNVQRQDTPNDPNYDQAEPDDPEGATATDLYSERFDLFGFPSQLTRNTAIYKEGPNAGQPMVSGFNAAGAWKQTRGDSAVFIAILDTGIKWDRAGLRNKIHLNRGELPPARDASGQTHPSAGLGGYDLNGSGVLDVDDYAADARVLAVKPSGQAKITGLDLIHAFSDGRDDDRNGFVDDIAGWNFFDNTNDPTDRSSYFAAENHGSGRAEEAVEEGNEGSGSIGVCPKCQFMPIRTWDTFVSDGNTFGMGILFATISGASVIEGANGSLYHSAFTEAASEYAYQHGVVQTFSGDDLNTANHNYPGNYGHVMLIQGTVPDTMTLSYDMGPEAKSLFASLGVPVGTEIPTMTYFRGANTTQFGGKSSIAMTGGTGSENTGKASGAAGLVISAGRQHGITLRPDETRAILEQTAEDVTAGNTVGVGLPDFAQVGWDPHFGWGRVNLGKAVSAALNAATIPPEAAIYAPDWYAPLTGASVHVTGLARARFASGGQFHYRVEWGAGQAPTSWTKVKEGDASGSLTDLGTIDLASVRSVLASFTPPTDLGGPVYSPTSPHPLGSEFTVRLTVTAAGQGRVVGIDRRVFSIVDDSTLLPGYPKKMGTGGEAPIRFADLEGDGVQELIVPTEDGTVHAYRPDGSELPGWPVHTRLMWQLSGHEKAPGFKDLLDTAPPREPLRAPAIADLEGDGTLELVTAAGTHVYVWEPNGKLRPGFPVSSSFAFCGPSLQSQPLRHPKCGFLASPSLARLEGGTTLDIVQPALDGHLYAWRPDGTPVPGYPIALVDPSVPADQRMIAESVN
ncbi:MAG: S8 family serine peptidase, partial [Actinomycetota bacterium]